MAQILRVLDDLGLPRTDVRVTVSASELTSVTLNGSTTYLGPGLEVEAAPDANGGITLYDRVESLTPASYRFAVDILADAVDVNPAAGVHQRFRNITAEDLRKAQITALDGTRSPLLDEVGRAGPVDAVAKALNQGAKLAATSDGELPGVRLVNATGFSSAVRADALPDGYAWGVRTRGGTVELMGSGDAAALPAAAGSAAPQGFGETVADFFEGLVSGVKDAATFVLRKIGDAVEFVCEIAGAVKRWVLDSLEEIGAFFTWLWNEIKVGLEKLWQWLKFLFDWDDILRVRNALVEVTSQQLTHLEGEIRESKTTVNAGFDLLASQLDTWRAEAGVPVRRLPPPVPGTSGKDAVRAARTDGDQAATDKAAGNPVVGWVSSRLAGLMQEVVTVEGPSPFDRLADGATDFVRGLAGDQLANLERCVETISADMATLFGEEVPSLDELSFDTIRTALVSVGVEAVRVLVDGLRSLVLRLVDLAADVIAAVHAGLFRTMRFPIIEKLVALVSDTPVDTSVRLIDGMMLLVAVPTTITYKLIAGVQSIPRFEDALDAPSGRVAVQSEAVLSADATTAARQVVASTFDPATMETLSRITHIAVPVFKVGKSYWDALQAGYGDEIPSGPPAWWKQILGIAPMVISLGAEAKGIRTHRGTTVTVLESLATVISAVQVSKSIVLACDAKMGQPYAPIVRNEATIDLACSALHLICRIGVYSVVIDGNYAKRAATTDEAEISRLWRDDALQSVLFVEQLLDHMSFMLSATAKVTREPNTKGICIIGAAITRLVTLGLAASAVVVAIETDQKIGG